MLTFEKKFSKVYKLVENNHQQLFVFGRSICLQSEFASSISSLIPFHISLPIKTASIAPLFSLPGKASSSSAFPSFFATSSSRSGFTSSSLSSPLSSSFLTSWPGSFTFSTESSLLPLSSSLAISSWSSSYCCSSFTSRGSLICKGTLLSCLNTFTGKAAGNSHYLRL